MSRATHDDSLLSRRPIIIGMLHLPALPGSPRYAGDLSALVESVLADARTLREGGIEFAMIENFGDSPFFPQSVPAITLAHMTAIALRVRSETGLRIGINVLRNDGCGALSVAHAVGAEFIRVNVLCGARVTDQGVIEGIAHDLLRLRRNLAADHIAILADVDVKHSAPLGVRAIEDEVHDLVGRGGANAVIVSGNATGLAVDRDQLSRVRSAAVSAPVLIGSGASAENFSELLQLASGAIVGTSLKRNGRVDEPVELARVQEFVRCAKQRDHQ